MIDKCSVCGEPAMTWWANLPDWAWCKDHEPEDNWMPPEEDE